MMAIAEVLQQLDREKVQDAETQQIRDVSIEGNSIDDTKSVEPLKENGDKLTLKEAKIRSTMRCKEVLRLLSRLLLNAACRY